MDVRMLELINLGLLIICLYIIKGIIEKTAGTSKNKKVGALFFLNSDESTKGLKMTMLGITLWAIKEGLEASEIIIETEITEIYTALGIITSLVLSYGLYLLIGVFRKKKPL